MYLNLRVCMLCDDTIVCGKDLDVNDTYLRYIDLNLHNYLWKIGWEVLGDNLIISTTFYSCFDIVYDFNPLSLLDFIPLIIGVSGSLGEKHEIVLKASQTCKREQSTCVIFDSYGGDWVYIRKRYELKRGPNYTLKEMDHSTLLPLLSTMAITWFFKVSIL